MTHFVRTYTDLQAFVTVALPFMLEEEALYNLQLGVLEGMREDPTLEPALLATLHAESGETTAVATQNQGLRLLISGGAEEAVVELSDVIASTTSSVPGVMAPTQVATWFANAWCRSRGIHRTTTMRTGLYALHHLAPPLPPPGHAVVATSQHLSLLLDWTTRFFEELSLHARPPSRERLQKRIDAGNAILWLMPSGEPSSMACVVRESPAGGTVSVVYTPPHLRGQGFASACVSKACEVIFQRGKQFCTLFADLDNPTSTALYQRLGFQLVANHSEISFIDPRAPTG